MKTLGLLGGMHFESTAPYYTIINEYAPSTLGARHSVPIYLYSVNQEEMLQYVIVGYWDSFPAVYCKAARSLEAAGVDAFVICASLAHKVADAVEKSVDVPSLHLADFTAEGIVEKGLERVGLLGTKVVMEGDFVKGRIENRLEVEVLISGADDRVKVNSGIVDELRTGNVSDATKSMFIAVAKDLIVAAAQDIMLGSTDLGSLLTETDLSIRCLIPRNCMRMELLNGLLIKTTKIERTANRRETLGIS